MCLARLASHLREIPSEGASAPDHSTVIERAVQSYRVRRGSYCSALNSLLAASTYPPAPDGYKAHGDVNVLREALGIE